MTCAMRNGIVLKEEIRGINECDMEEFGLLG